MKKLLVSFLCLSTLIYSKAYAGDNCYLSCCTYECGDCPVSLWCPTDCYGKLFVTADYLFWKAREDGLAYAISGLRTSNNLPSIADGGTYYPDFKFDSGFRVGVGYLVPTLCWSVYLNYTRFNTSASDEVFVPAVGGAFTLWEVWGAPSGGTFANAASAGWNLHFQTLDLEIAYSFIYRNSFVFRPYGGLEGVWTDSDYNIFYSILPDFFQSIQNDQSFSGVGPRLGFASNWNICRFLSIFADTAFAAVWGRYAVDRQDVVQTAVGNAAVWIQPDDDFSTVRPIFDFEIGLVGDFCLCNRLNIFAKVSYETLIFFKHGQFMKFVDGNIATAAGNFGAYFNTNGDLTFHGLTVSAGISF